MLDLRHYFKRDSFATRPLLPTSKFRKKASKRFGLEISQFPRGNKVLERLERQKIFTPFLRVELPLKKAKVSEDEEFAGFLDDADDWEGKTTSMYDNQTRYLEPENGLAWIEEGWLYDPRAHDFIPWEEHTNRDGDRIVRSYYSIFQIFELFTKLESLCARLKLNSWADKSYEDRLRYINFLNMNAEIQLDHVFQDDLYAKIARTCQLISTAYYSRSKSDARRHTISYAQVHWQTENDKYREYQREWAPTELANELDLDVEDLEQMHRKVDGKISFKDPLSNWSDLVRYIDPRKRENLGGIALVGELLRRMRFMLEQFISDLTGEPHANEKRRQRHRQEFFGADDRIEHLEYLTNRYNLNPRPRVIFVVEGETEEEIIPKIATNVWGVQLWRVHANVIPLRGISKFTGDKEQHYGALEKFIDYHHSHQTLVYILLDNEGRAAHTRQKLLGKKSDFYPGRDVTKEDYIKLWDWSLEFDNFSNSELAAALNSLTERSTPFSSDHVEELRNQHSDVGKPFRRLFEQKTNEQFKKMEFVETLFEPVLDEPENEFDQHGELRTDPETGEVIRPILEIVRNVINLANQNVPPANKDVREKNQEGGFFGKYEEN